MPFPPLLFNPILKPKVWGGRWLVNLGKKLPPDELIGESWELADLPEEIEAGRELHIDQALQCIHFGPPPPQRRLRRPTVVRGVKSTPLLETDFFSIERIEAGPECGGLTMATSGLPMIFMMLHGRADITAQAMGLEPTPFLLGSTALIPAALTTFGFSFHEPCQMLRVSLPSQLKGMIA